MDEDRWGVEYKHSGTDSLSLSLSVSLSLSLSLSLPLNICIYIYMHIDIHIQRLRGNILRTVSRLLSCRCSSGGLHLSSVSVLLLGSWLLHVAGLRYSAFRECRRENLGGPFIQRAGDPGTCLKVTLTRRSTCVARGFPPNICERLMSPRTRSKHGRCGNSLDVGIRMST